MTMKLVYWDLFAKATAPAIALEIAGADWEMGPKPGDKGGDLWAEWIAMKWETTWGFLPNLELADGKKVGSELAILQYLARKYPVLAGADDDEFLVSQELLHQAEELYQKITANTPTVMAPEKSPEAYKTFVEGADKNTHSAQQGLQVYLAQFDEFMGKRGGKDGKYTASGFTVGEIKLFSVLAMLQKFLPDAVDKYANLKAFVDRMSADAKVAGVLKGTAKNMTKEFNQYFIAPKN